MIKKGIVFYCFLIVVAFSLMFSISSICHAIGDDENKTNKNEKKEEPPKIGNFSLPASQQPGSLISFGENIFDKGTTQFSLVGDYFKGSARYSTDVIPALLYCLTDTSSLLFTVPYAARYKEGDNRSSGIEDMNLQFEHAINTNSNKCYSDLATIVANVTFPTGSATKTPPTGFGAPTYFLGGVFLRLYVDWYFLTSHGFLATTSHHGTKFGNQFLYQFGLGRNIAYISDKFIFDWLVELTGQYISRNKIMGEEDPNSGGNTVLLTPSLWFSTKRTIFQFGIGSPVVQHLFGVQRKNHYVLIGSFRWTF